MPPKGDDEGSAQVAETSLRVRGAVEGDETSLSWIVSHFTPLLLAQARYRLSRHLQDRYDPEDLVQRVWVICLPRLRDLVPRDGRMTPVLLKFLSSTLLQDYRNLLAKNAGKPLELSPTPLGGVDSLAPDLPAQCSGAPTRVMRRELADGVTESLEALAGQDREILILRGMEQLPYKHIAAKLELPEATCRVRYFRALQHLRECLPASIVDEMEGI